MTALRSPDQAGSTTSRRPRRTPRLLIRGVGLIAVAVAVAVGSQILASARSSSVPVASIPVLPDQIGGAGGPTVVDLDIGDGATTANADDTARIRENIAFWTKKLKAHANDFVAAEKLGESQIDLARATGDLSAYVAAEQSFDTALKLYPGMPAAQTFKGVVLVSLHRFAEARALATAILADRPDDPTALATLGDASLELGDVAAARTAYQRLAVIAPGAAASVRLGHLAFVAGDTEAAVRHARAAVSAADADEEGIGERAGFYRYQLADTLISTGDRTAASAAYRDAIGHDPRSFLAHAGLARALAADGKLDEAIDAVSVAIAIVPQPAMLARRADLYQLRDGAGDAKRAEQDRGTVLAIAQLGVGSGSVHDRTLVLFLANHGLESARAVALAETEIAVRKDVYGYDALAWALLADGRPADADTAIQTALGFGTKDALILYHAGMIGLALGDTGRARTQLQGALDLDPSFDALQAERAREALSRL